jgi:iron(III) transport system substrate-binding protein
MYMKRGIALIQPRRCAGALLVVALLLACAVFASGCGGSKGASNGSGGSATITLYSAQHEQTTSALIAAFTKQTGIKVRVDNDDEDVLTAQIEQEGSRSPADVFYTENSNWLEQLNERGLLAKVEGPALAEVPRQDSAANGDWLGVSARISVLAYNTSKLKPAQLPKSVMELADPKWKGKIELAPAETDFWPIVSSVARVKGHAAALAWLNALKSNAGTRRGSGNHRARLDQPLLLLPSAGRGWQDSREIPNRLFRSRRSWICRGHIWSRHLEVLQEQGRSTEVPQLPDR